VGALVDRLAAAFRQANIPDPVAEAREIIAALYDAPRFWPIANATTLVDRQTLERAERALSRRILGAPIPYAVGRASFRHLTLDVDERVLIPRPETEQLVDLVLDEMRATPGGVAVDVGTGSGAIALALAVARANVAIAAPLLRSPVDLVHGNLLAPLFDVRARVVVSNPPYIALGEAASLPMSVRDWEPAVALYSGADGMSATARLVREAAEVLVPHGLLALEVDIRRASLAAELVSRDRSFRSVRVVLDLTGRERFVLARRAPA
jgi:release factor glutamine methyltransferase